ncbi:MAG: TlpA family protein disulfide reductase [Planctomycetes bacterium]|nr:TlpA family protein disulfide reductase [Planctomycetota bacterium]MCB9889187.1 TlpA family protein disulfide reductase [Planctomycetota bacterium]
MKRLKDKPFALIGVNSDRDRDQIKKVMKQKEITWRSFWNGGGTQGPISTAWNVSGWPTIYVLDENGVIRFKNVREHAMDEAVDSLLAAMEKNKGKTAPAGTDAGAAKHDGKKGE